MNECNFVECNSIEKTYYQRNRDVIIIKKASRDKYRNLSEEEKNIKRENMEKTDIIICLKSFNVIINKVVF